MVPLMNEARRFVAIGIASTLAYLVIYAGLRTVTSAPLANAAALLITAVANTWANRRFTFGVRGREGAARDHLGGLIAFGIALAITTSAIGLLHAMSSDPGRIAELFVLVAANAIATVVRFVVLRNWIARAPRTPVTDQPHN